MKSVNILRLLFSICIFNSAAQSQTLAQSWKAITEMKEGPWFSSPEAIAIAENVLLYQRSIGGWPKNIQMQKDLNDTEKKKLLSEKDNTDGITIDNGATAQEMLFLSKMYRQNPDERYQKAFMLGLDYLLKAQYDNGGWPQFFP